MIIICANCGEDITNNITKQTDDYWVSYHTCSDKKEPSVHILLIAK